MAAPTETFTDRMVEKTLGRTGIQPKRGKNYNYDLRWYARPDGYIVQLQSDPQSRAYYEDKGFHILADQPARGESISEIEEWERIERPRVIAEQRRKANLINAIRKADSKDPTLSALIDLDGIDDQSIDELEATIKAIRERGTLVRVVDTTPKRGEPEPALLRGVEVTETLEDLQRKLGAEGSRATTIEGRGHDPIDESRRRGRSS
jgi:hypothetical protein